MSGGSFDYLYNRIYNENPLDTWTLELLEKMSEWLAEPEQNQKAAADELKRVHAELTEIKERIFKFAQNSPFLDLLKEAEWWCSCDTGKDDFESEWAKYEAQQSVQPTLLTLCPYCERKHDSRLACPEYAAKSQSG